MLSRNEAIARMNAHGASGSPFVFFTDFEGTKAWIKPPGDIDPDEMLYAFGGQSNFDGPLPQKREVSLFKSPKPFHEFHQQFDAVVAYLHKGHSFLVNHTHQTPIHLSVSLRDLFQISSAKYKLWYRDEFVVFSPETFIHTRSNRVFTHPMKGTIDAQVAQAKTTILADKKELAEHITIVDLLRNDLSQIAENVKVNRFRYIEEVKGNEKTLLQVSSEIEGRLREGWQKHLGSMLFSLLPAGSISGAPKARTLDVIHETEGYERGFYTGICGYFDGKELDTGIMIRFIEKQGEDLFFKSGGGITASSNARSEYQEFIDKIYVPVY